MENISNAHKATLSFVKNQLYKKARKIKMKKNKDKTDKEKETKITAYVKR